MIIDTTRSRLDYNFTEAHAIARLQELEVHKTRYQQGIMQLHDKGFISTRKLLEELGMDYDEEVRRMRRVQRESER